MAVSNTLTSIMPKILARALLVLREMAIMPRIVNGDFQPEVAAKGATINIPIPTARTATDVTPGPTPPDPSGTVSSTVAVELNNWKKANFGLTDKELGEIDKNAAFIPMEMGEAIRALANAVNASLHAEYLGIYGWAGNPTYYAFGQETGGPGVTTATDMRKVLNQQLAPKADRRGVLDFTAEANALALAQFSDAEKVMSAAVKIEGEVGRKFGIDWFADDGVKTHIAGTITTGLINKAATAIAVGDKTCTATTAATTGACALKVGDIILFAGDTQTYVLTADATQPSAASNVTLNFEPGKKVAATGSEAITVKGSHVVELGFHRDAFACAIRPLETLTTDLQLGNQIMSLTDPQTGISLRLEVSRQYKQTMWELDILWGAKLVRPALAMRYASKP